MSRPRAAREPLFNAPRAAVALTASILVLYAVQSRAPGGAGAVEALGLTPAAVRAGQLWRLATVLLVHGGWAHALLNALGALAFGAPVARWLGGRGAGAVFLLFYIACGVIASVGYVAAHWGGDELLVGASAAISGLMGASSRLIDRPGRLAGLRSRSVWGLAVGWGFINLLMALGWIDLGTGGAPIAWEAHLFGYAAGLLLIGPASRLVGRAG